MSDVLIAYAPTITAVLGAAAGLVLGRRMRPSPPEPVRPICGCTHNYGAHENGRACKAIDKRPDHWDHVNRADHWVSAPCPCMRYDGPDPAIFGLDVTT